MMRGTFGNIRLRNQMAPDTEGGWTLHLPGKEQTSIYDAAMKYKGHGYAAGRYRGQGIRVRILAGLGSQGHPAAGRARGDGGKLRAHPPQ